MSLVPVTQKLGFGMAFWDALGYDDFFYNGPYPMFYAGVMSRGKVNPFLLKYLERHKSDPSLRSSLPPPRRRGLPEVDGFSSFSPNLHLPGGIPIGPKLPSANFGLNCGTGMRFLRTTK